GVARPAAGDGAGAGRGAAEGRAGAEGGHDGDAGRRRQAPPGDRLAAAHPARPDARRHSRRLAPPGGVTERVILVGRVEAWRGPTALSETLPSGLVAKPPRPDLRSLASD